jgi:hypothetical protein
MILLSKSTKKNAAVPTYSYYKVQRSSDKSDRTANITMHDFVKQYRDNYYLIHEAITNIYDKDFCPVLIICRELPRLLSQSIDRYVKKHILPQDKPDLKIIHTVAAYDGRIHDFAEGVFELIVCVDCTEDYVKKHMVAINELLEPEIRHILFIKTASVDKNNTVLVKWPRGVEAVEDKPVEGVEGASYKGYLLPVL